MAESGYDPRAWATPTDAPTIHPDAAQPGTTTSRRRRDPIALLVGLICLVLAGLAMASPATLVAVDPRWVLAGAAVVIGGGALLCAARR
ncbi:hypothetical protein [Actinomycetospora sp. NBRC 106378]|uniref:hypothetical protein n=1 Tax=Actinomycetospora sp. NBRC 106378 TaxID=3032208 RepID=UPI00249FF4FA|nr:hypothetical protein [Actinomycetospora sp. NBRC 106378]GLZ50734.1 hypothetical protein Acsp07_03510 [Actinomycetospora sp. NBRC 106378]